MEREAQSNIEVTDILPGEDTQPTRYRLSVCGEPDSRLLLTVGTYLVGSGSECDLVLDDRTVSRVHLEVSVLDGRVRLRDLGSRNGSFHGGVRFQEIEAGAGTRVRVGTTDLVLLNADLEESLENGPDSFGRLWGRSPAMRRVFALLRRVAASEAGVLVRGETGTGKELCAEALHRGSRRATGPFVVVDLAGIPSNLLESELFGHVRGAFTGAMTDRAGAFERAHGGTVFLDEIGELPLEVQPRLLRALENRQVKRVGANDYRRFDARIVAATNRDLRIEAKNGRFREDLYHRLAVVEVELPPLRTRREDIPLLVEKVLEHLKVETRLADATLAMFATYEWPGNVRELRNVVERAVSLGDEGNLAPELLPGTPRRTATSVPTASDAVLPFKEAKEQLVTAFERDYLAQLLARHDANVSAAARAAGIDRVYLHRLLRKHGLS